MFRVVFCRIIRSLSTEKGAFPGRLVGRVCQSNDRIMGHRATDTQSKKLAVEKFSSQKSRVNGHFCVPYSSLILLRRHLSLDDSRLPYTAPFCLPYSRPSPSAYHKQRLQNRGSHSGSEKFSRKEEKKKPSARALLCFWFTCESEIHQCRI